MAMRTWKVAIIGGGPGGLMTAYLLEKLAASPIDLTLYEASHRLGGKIKTMSFGSTPAPYEAGAAEFYDYSSIDDDPLRLLVKELGLSIHQMSGSAVVMDEGLLSNLDDVRECLGDAAARALVAFDRSAQDAMSPRDVYAIGESYREVLPQGLGCFGELLEAIDEPHAVRYINRLIHSDLATEPQNTSVSYGLQNYLMNHPAYVRLYAIEGGNEQLTLALAARITARILLQHRVTCVSRDCAGRLRVEATHTDSTGSDSFDSVIVALPIEHLAALHFSDPVLAQAMQRHLDHHNHPAHYLRITILFDHPFWRPMLPGSFFMLDRFDGCCLYDESSRNPGSPHAVLGWLIGGSSALQLGQLPDDELVRLALNSLPSQLALGRGHVIEARVHRWLHAVSALPGGCTPLPIDRRHQPDPLHHPNLFVVGDYLFDSTLNGVLDSAEHVSGWLSDLINAGPGVLL